MGIPAMARVISILLFVISFPGTILGLNVGTDRMLSMAGIEPDGRLVALCSFFLPLVLVSVVAVGAYDDGVSRARSVLGLKGRPEDRS